MLHFREQKGRTRRAAPGDAGAAGPDLKSDVQTQSPTSDLWGFIDRIYCINLSTRPDRKRSAQAEFDGVGLGERVELITVEKHPTDTEQGIYEAHAACLREGL